MTDPKSCYQVPLKPRQHMDTVIRDLYEARIEARKRRDFVEADRLAEKMCRLWFDCWNEDNWRKGALRMRDEDDPPTLRDTGFDDPPTLR